MILIRLVPAFTLAGPGALLGRLADYGTIATGVATIAIFVSVWLVRKQVKQQAEDSRAELITAMTSLMISVSRVFIEYPEMREYFYGGKTPSEDDRQRAEAIAVTIADAMDHVAAFLDPMPAPTQRAWKAYFRDMFDKSPMLRDYLREHVEWYGPKLREYLALGPE